MKRFYKSVSLRPEDNGHAILLDGRPVRTPEKHPLVLASLPLAEAVADEWRDQGEEIRVERMALLRLANTAIDIVGRQRQGVIDNLASYGGSDLLCYFAEAPADLLVEQERAWRPLLRWAEEAFEASLQTCQGIAFVSQSPEALARLRQAVAGHDDLELAALNDFITITGSLLLALALSHGVLDLDAGWAAARVDELFQARRWGEDAEEMRRTAGRRAEMEHAVRFLALHREGMPQRS